MALGEGQEMTLTFNTHIPSLTQLVVDASTKFRWKNDLAKVKKNIFGRKSGPAKTMFGQKSGRTGRITDDGLVCILKTPTQTLVCFCFFVHLANCLTCNYYAPISIFCQRRSGEDTGTRGNRQQKSQPSGIR